MRIKIQTLIDEFCPTYRISKILGLNDGTVRWWIKKLGLIPAKDGILCKEGKRFKRCPKCKHVKEITENNFVFKNGKHTSYCRTCSKQMSYDRHRGFKQKCVSYKGNKCQNCGYDKCLAAMDFHHTDPTRKDYQISEIRFKQWDLIKKELDKTILLCRNCHAEIHDKEGWLHNSNYLDTKSVH